MNTDPIVIVGAARTPMGGFQGDFRTSPRRRSGRARLRRQSSGRASRPRASTRS